MPERFDLGGAAFRLVIDGSAFQPSLARAEQDATRASQRIQATLSGIGRGVGGSGGVTIAVKADVGQANTALNGIQQRARELQAASRVTLAIRADGGQAEAEIRQVQQALAAAQRRDRVTIQLRAEAGQAQQTLSRLEAEIRAAERRGAKITVNVDTRDAEARLGRIQQLAAAVGRGVVQGSGVGSGFLLGAGAGIGAIASLGVATGISQLTQAIGGGISAGIRYNSTFEQINNTLLHFTGSAEAAQQALAGFRKLDIESPFIEAQVQGAGANFIRVAQGDIQRAQELTELTTQLAAAHPERGFEEMQAAILQLISGDFQAFEDRTNIAFGTVRRLTQQGITGMELYRRAVQAAGASPELFAKNADTFQARLSTLQSNIQKFQGAITKGAFDQISGGLDAVNDAVQQNSEGWAKLGEIVGRTTAEFLGFDRIARDIGQISGFAASRLQPVAVAANPAAAAATSADQAARQALTAQRDEVARITAELKLNEDAAKRVKSEYEAAIAPLQRQLDLINQPNFDIQRRQAEAQLSQARATRLGEQALGPVEVRADVAGQRAVLALEREAIEIRQRRAALAEQIGQAEQSIARRTAEIQIRAAEEGARAQQTASQARQQARQDEISEIQEEVRLRRQGVADAVAGEREIADAARQGFADRERALDRANQRSQEFFRAEIERLQEINRIANQPRGPSASELALRQLDETERARAASRTLSDAQTAVRNADTRPERQAAESRLREIERQQAVDRQRATLEQRITAEREAADKARLAREEQIRRLEVQAREEDRRYQAEKEARAERERLAERAAAEQLRVDERTERNLQREEDNRIRELEKADREAARADQREIAASLAAIAEQRAGLQAGADSTGLANDQANLDRLRELAANESKELELRQQLLDGQDAFLTASAARAKVIADSAATLVGIDAQQDAAVKALASLSILEQLATFKSDFDEALTPIETKTRELEQRLRDVNAAIVVAEASLKELQAAQASQTPAAAAPTPGGEGFGEFLGRVFPGIGDFAKIGQNLVDAVIGVFKASQPTLAEATLALFQTGTIDPVTDLLGLASPSRVFAQFGTDTAQGFLDGYQSLDLAVPIRAPFEESIVWMQGVPDHWRIAGEGASTQFLAGYDEATLERMIRAPFEESIRWLSGLADEMLRSGRESGVSWIAGWRQAGILRFLDGEMGDAIRLLGQFNSHFLTAGGNAAQSWINGFNGVMGGFSPQITIPTATGTSGTPDAPGGLRSVVDGSGQRIYRRYATGGWIPEPTWLVSARTGRAYGTAGESAPEYISPTGPMRGGTTTLNMPVSIDARGVQNAEQMVQRAMPVIMRNVVNLLDAAERGAPDPAPPTLGGA